MRLAGKFIGVEAGLLLAGTEFGRMMFPDEWPSWTVWGVVAALFLMSGVFFLWEEHSKKRKQKAEQKAEAALLKKLLDEGNYQVRELKAAVARLPQEALADGATCTELPDKTLIVTSADGSLILALPVTASIRSGTPRIEVILEGDPVSSVD